MESHSFKTSSSASSLQGTQALDSSLQNFQIESLDSAKNRRLFGDNLFNLRFTELKDSNSSRHLRHGFMDEDDFEEFKQDLVDIHRLRSEWKRNRRKLSTSRVRSHLPPSLLETVEESPCKPDSMMDFFQNDEHFQEFDRVFETFKSDGFSGSSDRYRYSPLFQRGEEDEDDDRYVDLDATDSEVFDDLKIDDIFSDFFDNDVDFKEFETEFQNFKMKRRSKALGEKFRNSVCDLIEDLKAFCDKESKGSNSAKLGADSDTNNSSSRLWSSSGGGEWDFIFDKIRRHGSAMSESSGTGKSHITTFYGSDQDLSKVLDRSPESSHDTGYYSTMPNAAAGTSTCDSSIDDCQLTCHYKCRPLVTLDCKSQDPDDVDEGMELFTEEQMQSDLSNTSPSTELASEPATEKDETDSGYRSGTIPDEKLPRKPSQATLNREELKKRILEFNRSIPGANFALKESGEAFQGFIKVTLNLIRPINMSLGARPPSIYEILTKEHIIDQSTQNVSFYMPRDTVKSIHVQSIATTKEVVTALLKKFHILDHPRKFAMYEQELVNNKIAKLRRVGDKECPLQVCLSWDQENLANHRLVLQENETGEIVWDAFSFPELNNFLKVLDREQTECTIQLQYKYKVMKRIIQQRMKELRKERERQKRESAALGEERERQKRESAALGEESVT